MYDADPYNEVRDALHQQVDSIRLNHDRFQDMVRSTANNATQLKELRRTLVIDIRAADRAHKDLRATVANVDKNRAQFPTIKDAEFEGRKAFVNNIQKILKQVKMGIESDAAKRKLEDDANKVRLAGMDENQQAMSAAIEKGNNRFIESQRLQTRDMIDQQDIALDHLGQAVDVLNDMGSTINVELKEQDKMLNDLSGEMTDAEGKMNMVNHYLNKLLKTKDGCQYGTIAVLAVILLVLIACIIWLPK